MSHNAHNPADGDARRRRLMMLCVGLRDLNTRINHCARGIKIQRRARSDLFHGGAESAADWESEQQVRPHVALDGRAESISGGQHALYIWEKYIETAAVVRGHTRVL